MNFILVYTTCSSADEAKKISKILLGQNLIACSNIIPGVTSMFDWEGKFDSQSEFSLLLKTVQDKFDAISVLIKENHSYEKPCIIGFPINNIDEDFGKWVQEIIRK